MQPNTKIYIVEDDSLLANDLRQHLEDLGQWVIGISGDSESAYQKIRASKPDIILMDIDINGDMNGIELSDKLRGHDNNPIIIYLTSNDDDVSFERARETKPFDFLSKPVRPRRLKRTLELAVEQLNKNAEGSNQWVIKEGTAFYKILISDLLFLEVQDKYCKLHMRDGIVHKIRLSLTEAKGVLGEHPFLQTHRSYMVNQKEILKYDISMSQLTLTASHIVPVSKSYKDKILHTLK